MLMINWRVKDFMKSLVFMTIPSAAVVVFYI